MTSEMWRVLPGEPGYEISDQGRVRRNGVIAAITRRSDSGYVVVSVRGKQWRLSRAVLFAFVGPPEEGQQASHLNGVRWDNRLSNLVWESGSANILRKHGHGTGKNQWGSWGKPCPRGHDNRGANRQCRDCDRDAKRLLRAATA